MTTKVTVAASAPTASGAPAAPTTAPFADQVSKPVFALAAAGDGTHTMTTPQFAAVVRRAGQRLDAMPS